MGIGALLVGSLPEKRLTEVAFDHVFRALLRRHCREALENVLCHLLAVRLLASDADLDATLEELHADFLPNGGNGIGAADLLEPTCGCFRARCGLVFRRLNRGFPLAGLAWIPEFAPEDESAFPFFGSHAVIASNKLCHVCQQAVRRDAQRYELEAAVPFAVENDGAVVLRLSDIDPPDGDPSALHHGDRITPRDQRAEALRKLTIATGGPDVFFLDPQERMTLVNWAFEPGIALGYLDRFCYCLLLG